MTNTAPILVLGEGQLSYGVDGSTITALKLFPLENGGVIVVGESTGGPLDPQIVLARFDYDGTLDSNFIARTDVFGGKTFSIYDAVEQPDGDIVVGGTVSLGGGHLAIGLVRYHPDGTLDTSFGSGGSTMQFTDIVDTDDAITLALQGNGQILVGGLGGSGALLARFNTNGSLDTSFGNGGAASYEPSRTDQFVPETVHQFSSVMVRPDGHIVAITATTNGDGIDGFGHELVQFNANGTLDTSFGTGGHAAVTGENFQFAKLDNNGNILVAGVTEVGDNNSPTGAAIDGFIARYKPDGSLDTSFAQGGIYTLENGRNAVDSATTISDFVVGPDGKIFFTGDSTLDGSHFDSVVGRLNADGFLDTSFANGAGVAFTPVVPGQSTAGPIAIDGNSKIFQVLEDTTGQVVIQGLNPDGTVDHAFNPAQSYVERGAPIVLEPKASVFDTEDEAANNFAGASVTLMRDGGANPDDVFGGSGSVPHVLTEGQALDINGFSFGTVTKNSGGVLTLTFNANADQSVVNLVLTSITYSNPSHNPPASVLIDWTFSDGGSNGAGAPLSASGSTLVTILPIDEPPVVTTSSGVTTATEHTPVIVDPGITVDDIDNTTLASASVTILNFADGDVLAFKPNAALFGNIHVSFNSSGTLLLTSDDASATLAQWEAALQSVTYNTRSLAPDTTPRQIQFSVNDGIDDSTATPLKIVEIQTVNDPPTLLSYQGAVYADFGQDDSTGGLVLEPNGDAVVLGGSFVLTGGGPGVGHNEAGLAAFAPSGSLDTAFGNGGKVLLAGGSTVASNGLLTPDGKIVALVQADVGEQELARFNSNGTLDTSFGGSGIVALPTDALAGISVASQEAFAVQSDGKIIVAAQSFNGGFPNFNLPVDVLLLRYNVNGTLDTTFGTGGTVRAAHRTDFPTPSGVAVDADGKIDVTVQTVASGPQYLIERYNSNGTLDTTFGNQGTVSSPIQKVQLTGQINNDVLAPVILSGGKILVLSSTFNADQSASDIAMVRYNHDGSVDPSFGATGTVTIDLAQFDEAKTVALQSDGKILVLGSSGDFPNGLFDSDGAVAENFVMRFLADGSIDTSFGTNGKTELPLIADLPDPFRNLNLPVGLQVGADGKILVAATALHNSANNDFVLVRLNADGSLDSTLGGPIYDQSGPPIVIDSHAFVSDPELQALGNYAGASLSLARHGGAHAGDVFGLSGLASISAGGDLVYSDVTVGSATQAGGTLVLTFNGSASESIVQNVVTSVTYANTQAHPPASVEIDWTVDDGNTGAQGLGGALSTTMTTEISIIAAHGSDIAPTVTAPVEASGTVETAIALPEITVFDPEVAVGIQTMTVEVESTGGTLAVAPDSGATVTTSQVGGTNILDILDIGGTTDQINAALASLTVTSQALGTFDVTVQAIDSEGALSAPHDIAVTATDTGQNLSVPIEASGTVGTAIALHDVEVFDPEVAAGIQTLTMEVESTGGTLAVDPASGATVTTSQVGGTNILDIGGTLDQINAALASLTVTSQALGTFDVTVQSSDGFLTQELNIEVTATDTGQNLRVPIEASGTVGTAIALHDVEVFDPEVAAGIQTLTMEVESTSGTLAVDPASGATVTTSQVGGTNILDIGGTLDQINAALASLTVTSQALGTFDVIVQSSDGFLTQELNIEVTATAPTDTAPTVTAPTAASGVTGSAIALAGLSVFDPEVAAGSQALTVDVQSDTGTFTVDPASGATVTPDVRDNGITIDGALDQINAALASLTVTSPTTGTFDVIVQARDSLNVPSAAQHIAVTTSADTAPTVTAPTAASGAAGSAIALAGLSVFDPEVAAGSQALTVDVQSDTGTFAVDPASGATVTPDVRDNGITIDGRLDQINAALASLTVTNPTIGTFDVIVQARDSAGALSAAQHIAVTTSDTAPTVTAPTAVSGTAGTPIAFPGLSVFDPEVAAGTQALTVDVQSDTGTLTVAPDSGVAVTPHDRDNGITIDGTLDQINAALSSLEVKSQTIGTFDVIVQARDSLGALSAAQHIAVTTTDTAPTMTAPTAASGAAGSAIALTGLSVFDPEVAAGSQTLTVDVQSDTGTFAVDPASGATVTPGVRDNGITIDGTLDQINAALASLTVTNPTTGTFDVIVQARDSLGVLSAAQHIAVTTTDTAPTMTAPTAASGAAGSAIALTGFSVFDPEVAAGIQTLTVDVQSDTGMLAVAPGSGATVTPDVRDNGITIGGTLDQINAALASLTVTSPTTGTFDVIVQARDSLNVPSAAQHIAVTTTDTAPTMTASTAASGVTGSAIALAGLSVFDPEVAAGSQALTVDVQSDTGTFAVDPASGATVTPDVRDSGITIGGTLDQINAALASLTVTSPTTGTFDVIVQARDSLNVPSVAQHIAVTTTPAPLVIPVGGTFTVAAGQTLQALSLTIGANATLHVDGTLSIQDGVVSGTVSNSGTITVELGASFSDDLQNLSGATFTNDGTTADTVALNAGTVTNTATGVWTGDVIAGANGTGGVINNQGVWNGAAHNDGGTIENAGTWTGAIIDTAGTFTNTGSVDGSITIAGTATFALEGTGSITNSSPVTDGGTFDISGLSSASTEIVDLAGSGGVTLGAKLLSIDNEVDQFTGTFSGGSGSALFVSGASIDLSKAHFSGWNAGQTVSLTGTGNAATLIGSVVDDQISVQAGDGIHNLSHAIDGGGGTNTVTLSGKISDYVLSNVVDAGHFTMTDSVPGRDGVDTLSNIQFIRFAGDGGKLVATADLLAAPAVTAMLTHDSGAPHDGTTNDPTVGGSGNANAIVSFTIDSHAIAATVKASADGSWTFDPTGLADGPHTLVAQEINSGGKIGTATVTFTLDTHASAPTLGLAVDSGAPGDKVTNVGTVNVTGLETGATWQYSTDGGKTFHAGTGTSVTLTGDGHTTLLVHQTDAAGNTSADASLSFTLDTTTSDTITTPSGTVANATQTIQGTGEAGAKIQLLDGTTALGAAVTVDTSGHWTDQVTLAGTGAHTLTAAATDVAGNTATSNVITLTLSSGDIIGQPDQTTVNGTPGNDHIVIGPTNLLVEAGAGDDTISLTSSASWAFHFLDGGAGTDTLDLSATSTTNTVDLSTGLASGNQIGSAFLSSVENVTGGSGNDTLIGNNSANKLDGGAGNDTIRGGSGADTIIGGAGNDTLTGGEGSDTFLFKPGFGKDVITDFQLGSATTTHDVLDLADLGFHSIQEMLNHTDHGANAVIHVGADTITLQGVNEAQLAAHQFDILV